MALHRERLLILCKTYPSPSANYVETSCVAAMTEDGRLIRLYPVPFRLMEEGHQFKKWQWIDADIEKAREDHRPESHRIRIDNLDLVGEPLPTRNDWAARRVYLDKVIRFDRFPALKAAGVAGKATLALLKPGRVLALEIDKARPSEWTPEERRKLEQAQRQGSLFDEPADQPPDILEKLPFDFYYRYTDADGTEHRHKIVDWEAGALFRNTVRSHGTDWQKPFRAKLEQDLVGKDLMFLMGTMHRFPEQWLIVSLIYPPTRLQQSLL